jgi:hypothetical protein
MTRIYVFKILQLGDDEKFHTVAESFYETELVPMRADRALQAQANTAKQTADTTAGTAGSEAAQEGSQLRTELEQRAQGHGTGFDPTDLNNMLVKQQEATGGANATLGGTGKLINLRTRGTAGGVAPALAEAARTQGRTLATGGLDVANANAQLKQAQQAQALQQLQGLYGTDTSNQLRAMGLSAEDLQNELAAGRQGWLQNTEGVLSSLGQLGQGVGAVMHGPCWIAAATFDGWEDPRTTLVREWLTGEFKKTWYGKITIDFYLRFGERVAKSKIAVRMLRPLFMLALKKAQENG